MKGIGWLLGVLLGVASGAGGTLVIQALDDGDSRDCQAMTREMRRWIDNIPPQPTAEELDRLETIADIKDKVCA